jgi:hypothetical protein
MAGRRDLIYIAMLVAIFSISFYKIFHKKTVAEDHTIDDQTLPPMNRYLMNIRLYLGLTTFNVIVISLITFIIFVFVFKTVKNEGDSPQSPSKYFKLYAEPVDKKKYNELTKEITQSEVKKLMNSEEFKRVYEEKGENEENWNWQSREKAKKVLFKDENEDDIKDEDLENLDVPSD